MSRVLGAVVFSCLLAAPAWADVTVKTSIKGPMGDTPSVQYIKDGKMRAETTVMGRQMITITDANARQMITLDPATKVATVFDLGKLGQQMQAQANPGEAKVSVTPTGQTKELLGRACTQYMLSISFSVTPPNMPKDQATTVTISGPAWIAKGAPGTKDFEDFYKIAGQNGLFGGGGPGGRGGRGNMAATDQGMWYRAYAEAGGIPYEQVLETKMEGPMANMMRGRGGMNAATTFTVTSVSTDPIPADLFEIPAGYAKRVQ